MLVEEVEETPGSRNRLEHAERHEERHDKTLVFAVRQSYHHKFVSWPDVQVVCFHVELKLIAKM